MKVIILFPRLDVTFKNTGPVPEKRGPIAPIRVHWKNFVTNLHNWHVKNGDTVKIIERPLWQFTPENCEEMDFDVLYVPHKEKHNFPVKKGKVFYYMQTTFPEYFTIDWQGWGGFLSYLSFNGYSRIKNQEVAIKNTMIYSDKKYNEEILPWFEKFRTELIKNNISKFAQPEIYDDGNIHCFNEKNYILFICQIPHDETIKYHAMGNPVPESLSLTLTAAINLKKKVIVKGHPINPGSMKPLIEITRQFPNARYVDDVSIHDALAKCDLAITVNSGAGLEAILHNKPIAVFGTSEYDEVAHLCYPFVSAIEKVINNKNLLQNVDKYPLFMYNYINTCYHSNNINTFGKLLEVIHAK